MSCDEVRLRLPTCQCGVSWFGSRCWRTCSRAEGPMAVCSGAISDDGAARLRTRRRRGRLQQDAAGHLRRVARRDAVRNPRGRPGRLVARSTRVAPDSQAAPARLAAPRRNPALYRWRSNAVRFTCSGIPSAMRRAPEQLQARSRLCVLQNCKAEPAPVGASSSGPGVGRMALAGKVPGR